MAKVSDELNLKITKAMERIEALYYDTKGKCYLSFSGGKDSTVVLALIKMCEYIYTIPKNAIPAVYCDTRIELDATSEFVRWCKDNWYGNVQIIYPEKTFPQVLNEFGKPLKSKMKSEFIERYQRNKDKEQYGYRTLMGIADLSYSKLKIADRDLHIMHDDFDIPISNKCCLYLKKKPFLQYNKDNDMQGYFLGIRTNEGGARQLAAEKRLANGGLLCTATRGKYTIKMPIIDWTDDDVDEFIKAYNVPLSKAYTDYGMTRTGCVGCPFSRHLGDDLKVLYENEPNKYKAATFWLDDVYIAQNVKLPFDKEYEKKRKEKWLVDGGYFDMRKQMLDEHRPLSLKWERFCNKDKFK